MISSLVAAAAFANSTSTTKPLGSYKISDVTVSGLSAGAYMATQMHVAYSETISGAAVFAGGPYYCAEANMNKALTSCMTGLPTLPDVDYSVSYTNTHSDKKDIDSVDNLKDDAVYLFSGKRDTTVNPNVMKALESYYVKVGVPAASIKTNFDMEAAHTFPTLDYGNECVVSKDPYISKCNFDGAGAALEHLYGASAVSRASVVKDNLWAFDQTPFYKGTSTSLDKTGYVYVPTSCQEGTDCHLHVSFHGCEQGASVVGTDYVEHTGFNEWAEGSSTIVLYPQVVTTLGTNPNGCWDWWAYTNKDYALKAGVQMQFVKDLIDELTA
jgi:predicted peptidase